MSVLRVLGRQSSINVRKVLWTCEEIGIDYVQEDWGTGFASTRTPEFLALNPNGLVPVIESDDGILWNPTRSAVISRPDTAATISYRRPPGGGHWSSDGWIGRQQS